MNPYEILGLSEDATFDEVVAAFRELAKRYHPDRASNEGERKRNEERFILITQAYNSIKAGMPLYTSRESSQSQTEEKRERTLAFARQFILSKNYDAAIKLLKGLRSDDQETMMLLGEAFLRKKRYHEALRCFKKVSDSNPWNLDARFNIAHIYEQIKLTNSAKKIYEEILKLDGTNTKALSRLQQLNIKKYPGWSDIFRKKAED